MIAGASSHAGLRKIISSFVSCVIEVSGVLTSMQACMPIVCEITENIVGFVHNMCARVLSCHLQQTAVLIIYLIPMSSMSAVS